MNKKEWKIGILLAAGFAAAYFIPFSNPKVGRAFLEGLYMLQDYAREHVLLCLIPAFFIAGAVASVINRGSVVRLMGPDANRGTAYGIAAVSGSILSVCSCTVLPLFAGIYTRGAGLGPATAFLYSGPAINVLAIVMTAQALGAKMGIARAVGATVFSVAIGLAMHFIFRKEEKKRHEEGKFKGLADRESARSGIMTAFFFFAMIVFLVILNWSNQPGMRLWNAIHSAKYFISGALLLAVVFMAIKWFSGKERLDWMESTWDFSKKIMPLLFLGVLAAGIILGRSTDRGLIPSSWITRFVGGNSLGANFFASISGAFMYFATLTEVPILQNLMANGMGNGPALALLLAGPALSLPSMLVIRSVLGTKKTLVYIALVVFMATGSGLIYGLIA